MTVARGQRDVRAGALAVLADVGAVEIQARQAGGRVRLVQLVWADDNLARAPVQQVVRLGPPDHAHVEVRGIDAEPLAVEGHPLRIGWFDARKLHVLGESRVPSHSQSPRLGRSQ